MTRTTLLLTLLLATFCTADAALAQTTVPINPLATYLRTSSDNGSLPAPALKLDTLGLAPGQFVLLERLGAFQPRGGVADASVGMLGVFSAGDTLLAASQPARVKHAIDAGVDIATASTYFGALVTDIPEDFFIDSVVVQIPVGATHLFICASDQLYYDNSDPNKDFAVRLTRVTPTAVADRAATARPAMLRLLAPSPNPFNPATTVSVELSEAAEITLAVHDALGRRLVTLAQREPMAAGRRSFQVDGRGWPSGVYFVHVAARNRSGQRHTATQRLLLAK